MTSAPEFQIAFEKYALSNGMRVILSPDRAVPVVTVYIVYGVGARAEQRGRTGFAHLFEHMMFQGSENAPKGAHFHLVESNGGSLNGSTHPDYTDYFEVLPSNKLALGLWLEADRMRALAITEENLANQKEAVKQERRLSFDNQPYATAVVDRWPELAFSNWQNAHSLIGSFEDLEAATVEDVARFFRTYYAPNNAVLAIAGDFDPREAAALVETHFGSIPPQPPAAPPDLAEPPRESACWETYHDRLARSPALILGFAGPARRSPDYEALVMADLLLTGGESSRFHQALLKGKQSLIHYEANLGWPFAGPTDYKDPGLYAMYLLYNPAFRGEEIAAQVEEQLDRLKTDPVSAAELDRTRIYLRSSRLRQMQSSHARAALLAKYELLDGDPNYLNTELDGFLAVTPERIQQAATAYFDSGRRVALDILPAGQEEE